MSANRYQGYNRNNNPNRKRGKAGRIAAAPYERNPSFHDDRISTIRRPPIRPSPYIEPATNQQPHNYGMSSHQSNTANLNNQGILLVNTESQENFHERQEPAQISQRIIEEVPNNNPFNFKIVRLLKSYPNKATFYVEFADNGKSAEMTIEQSYRKWRNYNQNLFNRIKIKRPISDSVACKKYECTLPDEYNTWFITTLMNNDNQIKRAGNNAEIKKVYMVCETTEIYQSVTRPHLERHRSDKKWIENILHHGKEPEKIIHKDHNKQIGFVMVEDSMWNGSIDKIHYVAIPHVEIFTLRELNASHLPLLKNIKDVGISKMKEKHNLSPFEYKIFIHYPPSCRHLHVHFSYLDVRKGGEHLLSTVINNIELVPDYYQKSELSYIVRADEPLGKELCDKVLYK